ncbi:MAG: glycoside hydrolase family 57 protein [Bacteroidia bacterium]|nr:glycoside hydrolase family 57 protein [Bacteroidia bacterium]
MRTVCFYFQVHQPFRLRRYRFFDIGNDHYYYDDYANRSIMRKVAERCYLPANKIMLELIRKYGNKFRIAYSVSGTALDQLQLYAPQVLESFKKLAATGNVEFLAETYSHSLSSLVNKEVFLSQVSQHAETIERLFGKKPEVFRNTELIYSDQIGADVSEIGFKAILTEGAKHILGWKSPNFLYCNAINPKLKVLLRNFRLSDDISFRFSNHDWSEYPLTAEKYVSWMNELPENEELINVFIDYETFGEHQWAETGIFDFLNALPGKIIKNSDFEFGTPSDVINHHQPVSAINAPEAISWADEERDLTAWQGNELQEDALRKLYDLLPEISECTDKEILNDWKLLQTSDHFYYMCTKWFSDGAVHKYFNPYNSPYDAFINYMNVITDFTERLKTMSASKVADISVV